MTPTDPAFNDLHLPVIGARSRAPSPSTCSQWVKRVATRDELIGHSTLFTPLVPNSCRNLSAVSLSKSLCRQLPPHRRKCRTQVQVRQGSLSRGPPPSTSPVLCNEHDSAITGSPRELT